MAAPKTEKPVGAGPWTIPPSVGIVGIGVVAALLGLLGIASSVGRSSFDSGASNVNNVSARKSQDLVLPQGQKLVINSLESCPGVRLNEQISVVLNSQGCDAAAIDRQVRLTETGPLTLDVGDDPIVLIPDLDGNIGALQDNDGTISLLPPTFGSDDGVVRMWSPAGKTVRFDRSDDSQAPVSLRPGDGLLHSSDSSDLFDFSSASPQPNQRQENESSESDLGFDPPNLSRFVPQLSLIAFLAIAGLVGYFYRTRLRRQWFPSPKSRTAEPSSEPAPDAPGPEHQVDIIDQLLWEIEQEQDPRKAIQRVYAAVESGLGNTALTRQPAESPAIYLARVFGRSEQARAPLAELTQLFEIARFSVTSVSETMRQESIDSLQALRSEFARMAPNNATNDASFRPSHPIASQGRQR